MPNLEPSSGATRIITMWRNESLLTVAFLEPTKRGQALSKAGKPLPHRATFSGCSKSLPHTRIQRDEHAYLRAGRLGPAQGVPALACPACRATASSSLSKSCISLSSSRPHTRMKDMKRCRTEGLKLQRIVDQLQMIANRTCRAADDL
jgi:hypothetical protein